ncbi:MAG: hypothetical protein Q8M07_02605 [Prosthecobacter sp.]|nr:hypothetical protein [Prosthecobacter sp.]
MHPRTAHQLRQPSRPPLGDKPPAKEAGAMPAAPITDPVLEQHILATYGPVLGTKALAQLLAYKYANAKQICNAISRELFPIPTTRAAGKRVAYYTDVARYLSSLRSQADAP